MLENTIRANLILILLGAPLFGGQESNGGGILQLAEFLNGPPQAAQKPASQPKSTTGPEREAILRSFYGHADWGLQILESLHALGYSFHQWNRSPPLSPEVIAKARRLLKQLKSSDAISLQEGLVDKTGQELWAVNRKISSTISLNSELWTPSSQGFFESCAQFYPFMVDSQTRLLKAQISQLSHCYSMVTSAIAVHEVLSLLDIESDRQYPYSSALLVFLGTRESLKGSRWETLLSERERVFALASNNVRSFIDRYRAYVADHMKGKRHPNYNPETELVPWVTAILALYSGSRGDIVDKLIARTDIVDSLNAPHGTSPFALLPVSTERTEAANPRMAPFLSGDPNYGDVKPLVIALDDSRAILLKAMEELGLEWHRFPSFPKRVFYLPQEIMIRGLNVKSEFLSLDPDYETPAAASAAEAQGLVSAILSKEKESRTLEGQVDRLAAAQAIVEKLFAEISYSRTEAGYSILVIDPVAGLLKQGDLTADGERNLQARWHELKTVGLILRKMALKEKRPFLEPRTFDRLLFIMNSLNSKARFLNNQRGGLTLSSRRLLDETLRWLEKTDLKVEVIGGFALSDRSGCDDMPWTVTVPSARGAYFSAENYLQDSLALYFSTGTTHLDHAGVRLQFSKTADGYVITHFGGDPVYMTLEKLTKKLDYYKEWKVSNSSYDPPKKSAFCDRLLAYLKKYPGRFSEGQRIAGVELQYAQHLGHWAFFSRSSKMPTLFGAKGPLPEYVRISWAPGDTATLEKELSERRLRFVAPLASLD
ncbi:MAG: hypothetical protein HYR96_04155 [Deltaproteobacteria bacterium]|nr:hypothetical protein [Deltaproteobacteria bacterium]MBI3295532.1 hypothetical protein [Deltaproteobacteria bacterium]